MKKLLRFLLICTLTIGLSACESNASNPQTTGNADADYLGKYLCTGITLDGLTMNPNGKWLELNADGTVTTFLTEEADEAEWKLEGENFTMTIAGKMVGTGTLQGQRTLVGNDGDGIHVCSGRNRSGRAGGILQQWFFCHVYLLWKPVCGSVSHRPFPARSSRIV